MARTLGRASPPPQPPPWRFAPLARFAVVGIAGVALLGFLFWMAPTGRDGGGGAYRTLASPPASGGDALDVIFAQSITAAEMQALLDAIDGEIAAGPTDIGRYTVRLEGRDASARREAALAMLRADPRVRFASPSLTEPAP